MSRAVVLLLLLAWTASARAETRRVAVVVGNNAGGGAQIPLRYAEIDAGKVSRVLVELGGVEPADLFLLQGKQLPALEDTLRRAKAKITAYQQDGLDRVVVIFYYSGHSDGVALELGKDRFTFAALRTWLQDTGAEVRLGLVDSCKSGALLRTKGGTPGPAFQIRLTDDLSSTGEALLTSSAADEDALESKEIGGSFFTHHLVSGLRGAADISGDARVTLSEAYQYAYKHTITTSGATLAGTQHPAYDYRMSGQGELILTELAQPTAALVLPDGFDRALVIEVARDQVIAELGRGVPAQIAVLPGRYGVRAWKQDRVFEGKLWVGANEVRAVRWNELHTITITSSTPKGDVLAHADEPPSSARAFTFGAGGRVGVARQIGVLTGARVGVRAARNHGLSLALDLTTASTDMLRETSAFVFGGYRVGFSAGRLRGWAGGEVGVGAVLQSLKETTWTGALAFGPFAGVAVGVTPSIAITVEAHVTGSLLERDGQTELVPHPAVWLGLDWRR